MPATVGILGPTVVAIDGELQDPGGRIVGRVLAALALRRGSRVTTERLIDDVWGEAAPARARASLQMHITKLRRLLEPTGVTIETVTDGYRLAGPPGSIDVDEFVNSAEDARTARTEGRWTTAAELSRRALALWRSDRVTSLDDSTLLSGELSSLTELRRQTRSIHLEATLALGGHEEGVAELEAAVSAEPLVERWWELLMIALYRSGRQADALDAYKRAAAVLGEELGIEPGPALANLEERILLQDPALLELPDSATSTVYELPPPTEPIIGRDADIQQAMSLLAGRRQLTILGPGGVGKTTLSLAVGRRLASGYPDGVLFWDLTACDSDQNVATELAEQLGIEPEPDALEASVDFLRSRALLLIADNCEHVLAGAATVVEAVLDRCPDVSVIATSRRPLSTPKESDLRIAPLAVPDAGADETELAGSPAVRLFATRAGDAVPNLDPGTPELTAVAAICRRLDGLPLAVELAASWSHLLTVRDIAGRLASLMDSPGASPDEGRHRSLEAAIGWSYSLLDAADRDAFERLAVFRSVFDLEAAEAVLERSPLEMLANLTDASMLSVDLSGPSARYRMLETIREFGLARLQERADFADLQAGYRSFVIQTALNAADALQEAEWFDRVQEMLPDLRSVLDTAAVAEPHLVVSVAEKLRAFWTQRGLAHEIEPRLASVVDGVQSASGWYTLGVMRYARGALDEAQATFESGLTVESGPEERARLVNALGVLALERGDYVRAAGAYREAGELFEAAGWPAGVAAAQLNQGIAALNQGRHDEAVEFLESARKLFGEVGDRREEAHALLRLAFASELSGESEVGRERAGAALRIARTLGPGLALADALQYTADVEVGAGDPTSARPLLAEAVEMFLALGHRVGLQRAMLTATAVAVADEQWTEAAEMNAYSAAIREDLAIPVPAANRAAVDGLRQAIAARVPEIRRKALAERARLAVVDDMAGRCLHFLQHPA